MLRTLYIFIYTFKYATMVYTRDPKWPKRRLADRRRKQLNYIYLGVFLLLVRDSFTTLFFLYICIYICIYVFTALFTTVALPLHRLQLVHVLHDNVHVCIHLYFLYNIQGEKNYKFTITHVHPCLRFKVSINNNNSNKKSQSEIFWCILYNMQICCVDTYKTCSPIWIKTQLLFIYIYIYIRWFSDKNNNLNQLICAVWVKQNSFFTFTIVSK